MNNVNQLKIGTKRGDESLININYDGHPTNCNCERCTKLRVRLATNKPLTDEEIESFSDLREWLPTKRICKYYDIPAEMWRKKDHKIRCENIHCRKYYEYL